MDKRIAIVTGASGGIGKEFTKLMLQEEVDEIWAIARNQEKLTALKNEFGDKIVTISKDLMNSTELHSLGEMLEKHKPVIAYLINNAGIARMASYQDFSIEEVENTIRINCSALAVLCSLCIPYMRRGSRILNLSSASSFQPLPYLNLYAATKAFERSYSRSLNVELKGTGITSTAVCPSWVDTDMLLKEYDGKRIKFPGLVTPDRVAITALRDAKRGKDMSVCTLYVKGTHVMAKVLPQKMMMKMWVRKIKKYIPNA
ncbi:SDR family NAD(P)-dependent oxidoreductase [Gorillibacterium timonense]|uniref:SDR family NAD(P)-dependent oxidoreductase n=1 Tax=Gorillibacterium timonense TaxID=1689269 RepID=UPI00071D073E|nr:SDR family NAD(P)-dependent oxidoreductase [Gorillibacterium timonense]